MNIEKFYYDEQTEMYEQMKKEQDGHLSFLCKDLFIGMSQTAFYKGSSFYHLFFFFIRAVRG